MNPIIFAMRRPMTVMVLVVAVALASGLAVYRMSIDIFPNLNLPVVYVCQPYGGMDPAQMEGLLTNYYEYHFLYINGIHHVESRNIQGMALMKLFFHPGTDMAQAMAETIGYVTRSRAFMPPGTVSPFVMRFDVGSIPVGYLVLRSDTKTIGEIQDQALFKVRPMFASLPGVSAPPPFGGSQRTVVVRVDPDRLRSYRMSPDEVISAIEAGNFISPSGNVRIDDMMPIVPINSLVKQVKDLESIPIRPGQDPTVYLRDVGTVSDASDIPTGYALANGRRAVYILVTKRADASTISVVRNVKHALPSMQAVLPPDIKVSFEFDQSPTVTRSMWTVVTEGLVGAGLTGLMVLLFLRDWRSVIVVVLNIPFALCGALVGLWLTGQSINLMTLGGLALAIGILVDESTVEVENIHHQMEGSRSVARSVRRGNQQTAVPRLLAMLCVLAVFIPSFFMQGAARALFVPLSLAVGFSMVASYLLSSTFVPVLSTWLLRHHPLDTHRRTTLFERLQVDYARLAEGMVHWRWLVVPVYLAATFTVIGLALLTLGWEIFPRVDAGRFQLRLRAADGTRYEKTEELAIAALRTIEDEVGKDNVEASVGYVGLIPSSYPINAIFQWTSGPQDAILRIALKRGTKIDLEAVKERLREKLSAQIPGVRLSFEPADIVSEVMSFGSPTPVEVSVNGPNLAENRAFAEKIRQELATVPSLRDLQYGLSLDYPTVSIDIDRERAGLSGVTARDVARSVVTATSSSRFVVPNYWPDPKSGIGYQVQVEIPYQIMNSVSQMETVPIQRPGLDRQVLLRDVATVRQSTTPGQYDRYNMKRTVSLTANIAGEDLGRVAAHVRKAITRAGAPPQGATVEIRGQIQPLDEILRGLTYGLLASIVVILLLLTANFQSVKLALVVVSTTPAVVAGVVVMLWLTGTTINLQSFNGAIMAIGVAVANAILLVTFAEQHRRDERMEPGPAAVAGARGRLRPILMTTCAMIAGMVPMAAGWGEGGEQTAPLGRAVIGGLAAATLATLFVLPTVFALVQGWAGRQSASLDPDDPASPHYHEELEEERELALARGNGSAKFGAFGLMVICSVSLAALTGCDHTTEGQTGATRNGAPTVRVVELVHPERHTVRRSVGEPGQLQAFETTPIHAKIAGYVKRWTVNIGSPVKKGLTLAELSDPELEAEHKQRLAMIHQAVAKQELARAAVKVAEADVASAEAKLLEVRTGVSRAQADLARWQAEYKRVEQLHRERALTGTLLDETLSKLHSSEASREEINAQVKTAQAALVQSRAALEKAHAEVAAAVAPIEVARQDANRTEALLGYTRIEAPFDGIVTERNVDTGELTHPGADSPPLFVVARSDVVTIKVDVPEMYATEVNPGDRAEIKLQAMKGKTVEGKVSRISWALDPRTRTIRVEIDIPNPGGTLRPGLYAYATIIVEEHHDVITLPTTAVFSDGGKDFCVVVADGKAQRRPISLGLSDGTRTEIVLGLEGDATAFSVVKAGASSLTDGQPVQADKPVAK
jgi:RND family efflux transporter MFP subunit